MPKRTRKARPTKPRPDFPLFPHATGRWAKKIRGKFHYFGKVSGDTRGDAALALWLDQKDDLLAGRTPRVGKEGMMIRDLANRFLNDRRGKLNSGELAERSFGDYHATCERIVKAFGPNRLVADLDASDFERFRAIMAKGWGPVTLANEIGRIRVVFRYATENQLVPTAVHYGSSFKKPSRKVLRQARATKGPRIFEADQLRKIIEEAGVQLRAMIYLGLNCGFGNSDVAALPRKSLDLKGGWVDFPRPKTAIPRRCPLWPETVAAVQEALAKRPEARDKAHDVLVFVTKYGRPWQVCEVNGTGDSGEPNLKVKQDDAVTKEFTKLLKALGLHRAGLGFYALRHTFETIGGDARDQVAVDAIMGHARDDMASLYRERVDDDRLLAVVEHVRKWLFQDTKTK